MNEIYFVSSVTITKNKRVDKSEKTGSNGKTTVVKTRLLIKKKEILFWIKGVTVTPYRRYNVKIK